MQAAVGTEDSLRWLDVLMRLEGEGCRGQILEAARQGLVARLVQVSEGPGAFTGKVLLCKDGKGILDLILQVGWWRGCPPPPERS